MRAFGSGSQLFRVDVVLRPIGVDRAVQTRLTAALTARLPEDDATLEPWGSLADVDEAYSYDMEPPEGTAGLGLWVRADGPGEAAATAWSEVSAASQEAAGRPLPLWDLRLVPRTAMLSPDEARGMR